MLLGARATSSTNTDHQPDEPSEDQAHEGRPEQEGDSGEDGHIADIRYACSSVTPIGLLS